VTPSARYAAAIEILDAILAGVAGEKALGKWARRSRFAGSSDRANVRDLVFSCLRCRASFAARGGALTGRGLILGYLRNAGVACDTIFSGAQYAPAKLGDAEILAPCDDPHPDTATRLDCPDWLVETLRHDLGDGFAPTMTLMQSRASVFLRVNTRRCSIESARDRLEAEGIETEIGPLAPTALLVTNNARRVKLSKPYLDGVVELQDAASQAVVDTIELLAGERVLDYCCGGGGKSLAMAARADCRFFAMDVDTRRTVDLPKRAARAGADITLLDHKNVQRQSRFDLVVCDAPCSGSGTWRRNPESKWSLDREKLDKYVLIQRGILDSASDLVTNTGRLVYMTCSLLAVENQDLIARFTMDNPKWEMVFSRQFLPPDGGDGLYVAHLKRS